MLRGANITLEAVTTIIATNDTAKLFSSETTASTTMTFLNDHHVQKVHFSFAVITLCYIPFILLTNNLVLWSTILFRKLHTPNNIMLASLATADLIMGVYCIPMYALSYIPSTEHLIKASGKYTCLAWFASMELAGAGSLKNLLLISADRFIAVVYPLSYSRVMTMRTTAIALTILWIYVIILTFVPFLGWNNYDPSIEDHNRRCNYYLTLPEGYVIWASFFTVTISIIIPLILNIKIFYTISNQQQRIKKSAHLWSAQQVKRFKDQVQTVRITGILFLLFILFWLPYILVAPLKYSNLSPRDIEMIKVIVQLLYFLNSVVNAPIYALMKTDYKVAYYLLLTTAIWKWGRLRRQSLDPEVFRRRWRTASDRRGQDSPIYRNSQQKCKMDISAIPRHFQYVREETIKNCSEQPLAINSHIKNKDNITLPYVPNYKYTVHKNYKLEENRANNRSDTSMRITKSYGKSLTEMKVTNENLTTKDETLRLQSVVQNNIKIQQ